MDSNARTMKSPDSVFYADLMTSMIRDIHNGTTRVKSVDRDVKYVSQRFSSEGLYFLTSILPLLGKALDQGLESGCFNPPLGFKLFKGTNLPCFMQDKFKQIFSPDGTILDHPDPYSVQELRQLFFFFYKLEISKDIDPSSRQAGEAVEKFVRTELELEDASFGHLDPELVRRAQRLLTSLFKGFDWKDILPRHGPGGVNTGEKGNGKWTFSRVYSHAHQCYPWYDYFVVSKGDEILDRLSWIKGLAKHDESWSKLCLVPKDSRGPRVISIEPLETQYLQQGQMRKLVKWIERHRLTKGCVNFTNQSINANLALSASVDRRFATLDLSEASDRVHVNLVRILFPEDACRYLFATRSEGTVLPDGQKLRFRKFAPMGSATCFPVLALTIWSLTRAYLDSVGCHDKCYVYGDDVVVPSAHFAGVTGVLEDSHLRVNREKSFVAGFFRESCGTDAHKGVVVTPLRVRKPWSGKSRDSAAFASYTSLANHLFSRGFWLTAETIRESCRKVFGTIPFGTPSSGFPCVSISSPVWADRLNKMAVKSVRWNSELQRWEFRVRCPKTSDVVSPIDGWSRLLKGLLVPSDFSSDESSGSPLRVALKSAPTKLTWRWSAI